MQQSTKRGRLLVAARSDCRCTPEGARPRHDHRVEWLCVVLHKRTYFFRDRGAMRLLRKDPTSLSPLSITSHASHSSLVRFLVFAPRPPSCAFKLHRTGREDLFTGSLWGGKNLFTTCSRGCSRLVHGCLFTHTVSKILLFTNCSRICSRLVHGSFVHGRFVHARELAWWVGWWVGGLQTSPSARARWVGGLLRSRSSFRRGRAAFVFCSRSKWFHQSVQGSSNRTPSISKCSPLQFPRLLSPLLFTK